MIHDGGSAVVTISFCPWCGARLPSSLRDEWFDRLEQIDIDPWVDEVPAEFTTDAWWNRPLDDTEEWTQERT